MLNQKLNSKNIHELGEVELVKKLDINLFNAFHQSQIKEAKLKEKGLSKMPSFTESQSQNSEQIKKLNPHHN